MLLLRMQNFQMQFLLATYFVCKYLNQKPAVFIQGLPDGKVEVIKLVVDADDEIFEFFTLLSRVRRNGYYNESIWAIYMISFKVQVFSFKRRRKIKKLLLQRQGPLSLKVRPMNR